MQHSPDRTLTTQLALELIRVDSANPPGRESPVADIVGEQLRHAGFRVSRHPLAAGRDGVIARWDGHDPSAPPIVLSGHLDTVPVGPSPWTHDPFGAIEGRRLYGRGSADMKGGVAAMVVAACRAARLGRGRAGMELVLTAGEENGCEGAARMVAEGALGAAGALVIAEPTGGAPVVAHKGLLWVQATARGRSAHASTPELGDNAIQAMAGALRRLDRMQVAGDRHPLLRSPTLNVGTISGGVRVNSVPDECTVTLDIRTVPGTEPSTVLRQLAAALGDAVELRVVRSLPAVATAPDDPWIADVQQVLQEVLGDRAELVGAEYVTDACVLKPAYGDIPTVICGPGDAAQAHTTDEWCSIDLIEAMAEVYFRIIGRWCHAGRPP